MQVVNTTSTDPVNMYNNMNTFISTPIVLIIVFMIIVVGTYFSPLLLACAYKKWIKYFNILPRIKY